MSGTLQIDGRILGREIAINKSSLVPCAGGKHAQSITGSTLFVHGKGRTMETTRATVSDDEARLTGNEAVMARLLVDEDDENDPVPYDDEDDESDYEPDLDYVETDYDRAEDLVSDPDYLAVRAEGYSH
jgi:hypothetical protein